MNSSTHDFSIMLGRLWTKGRTSQYSGRSLTSRSLKSRSSHIGSYSLQSPLLFVSCLDEPKVAQPVHKQINEHKDRPVAVNKSFCHLRLRMIVQDLSLHVPRYPSFLFAARPKISRTLLRFGLEACSEIGSATCLGLFQTVSCKFFKVSLI